MDIRAAKAAGDANNDWILTQRLVNAKLPKDKHVRESLSGYPGSNSPPSACAGHL